jgi:hypothetical protein
MALTLDGTLQTRLDGIEREPIAKLITTSFASSIPFDGNDLGLEEPDLYLDLQIKPTGELTLTTDYPGNGRFRLMQTDVDRTYWTEWPNLYCGWSGTTWDQCHLIKPDGGFILFWVTTLSYARRVGFTHITADPDDYSANASIMFTTSNYDSFQHLAAVYHANTAQYMLFYSWYDYSLGNYYIYKRTSANGTSWSGATDVTPASLGNTYPYLNLHVISLSDDDIVLSFDRTSNIEPVSGFNTSNCYYTVSQDDGATWAVPTAVTSYSGTGVAGRHPTVSEKSANVYYSFSEKQTFVVFDEDTPGVICDSGYFDVDDVWFYNGKMYCRVVRNAAGVKLTGGFYVVDPADMSVEKQYTSTTTPGWDPNLNLYQHLGRRVHGDGKYLISRVSSYGDAGGYSPANMGTVIVAEYDGVGADKVTQYHFGSGYDHPTYGWDENVAVTAAEGAPSEQVGDMELQFAWIDAANDRLYVWFYDGYLWSQWAALGWVDLTEAPDGETGYYTFNEIWRGNGWWMGDYYGWVENYDLSFEFGRYCPEDHVVILWRNSNNGSSVLVIDAESGVVQLAEQYATNNNFPYQGLYEAYVYDNKIYGSIYYTTGGGQGSWRGLWIYDMVSGSKQMVRPGYTTGDWYTFYDFDFSDIGNDYIWIGGAHGALRYHIGSQNFEIWSENYGPSDGQNLIPGFNLGMGHAYCHAIAVDLANDDVYVGSFYALVYQWSGVRRFNINGAYWKGQYATGIKSGTDLALGSINDLTQGNFESQISTVTDSDDILWAFWEHVNYDNSGGEEDIYWDNDEAETDVSDDLVDQLTVSHAIDTPSELVFNLSLGHLFDQQNSFSTKSYMFRRGRKITLQLGETISSTPYWEAQGTYVVEEAKLRYVRGDYPILEVTARTMDSLWREARIVLSDYYDEALPATILNDVLSDWTVLDGADYSIPSPMNASHEIWHQWSDESLYDMIKDILDHFEYTFFFDQDGVFTPKRVNFDRAVDHAYSDQTQIKEYTPDSTFSNFVNQVRVIGETHDLIEVVYDPELITTIGGTCGWWNETMVKKVWYNEERTRTCRNPYLNPIISTKDFQYFIFKGGGGEEITDEDNNELWVEVTIEGPNLIPVVVGLAATAIAVGTAAIICELDCGPYIFATNTTISLLCYAVLATATYDIEVWAQPVGEEKQTIQYLATDQDMMNLINQQPVIEEIEDSLCYTVGDCQRVAEYELKILKYQRERIRLSKLAHLQDELLDMITVKHPYTSAVMQLLIASLTRTLVIKGDMIDTIEGWRIL